jgi:uncharacterized metal-binding protein
MTLIGEGAQGEETMLKRTSAFVFLFCCVGAAMAAQSGQPANQQVDQRKNVAASVARMARVGSATSPSFSPDGSG